MASIRVDQRIRSHIPPLRADELAQLEENILRDGCRTPLTLWGDVLIDGHNRFAICQWHELPFKVEQRAFRSLEAALEWVETNQLGRRNLTPDQIAYFIGRKYEREKARHGGNRGNQYMAPSDQNDQLPTAERIASEHGISAPTVRRAAEFARNVDAIADEIGAVARSEILSGLHVDTGSGPRSLTRSDVADVAEALPEAKATGIVFASAADALRWARSVAKKEKRENMDRKSARRAEREIELARRIAALPDRKYGVILADPEWRFEPWSRETGMDRAADNHYPTSATEIIAERDVPSIAAADCVLFLWATAPMLPEALAVLQAWGFTYRSQFMWLKDRVGTGYWTRNKHELLLIGTRGNVPAPAPGDQFPSVIEAPVNEHSAKPEVVLEMIEAMFPNLPKIELNRRGPPRPAWSSWGLEAEGDQVEGVIGADRCERATDPG